MTMNLSLEDTKIELNTQNRSERTTLMQETHTAVWKCSSTGALILA